jgi:hypothetical protein
MTFLKGVVDGLSYIHRFSVILYSNQNRTLFLKWSLFSCLQEVANQLARLSVRACGRLGGYFPESSGLETPENVPVKKSLSAILTSFPNSQIYGQFIAIKWTTFSERRSVCVFTLFGLGFEN